MLYFQHSTLILYRRSLDTFYHVTWISIEHLLAKCNHIACYKLPCFLITIYRCTWHVTFHTVCFPHKFMNLHLPHWYISYCLDPINGQMYTLIIPCSHSVVPDTFCYAYFVTFCLIWIYWLDICINAHVYIKTKWKHYPLLPCDCWQLFHIQNAVLRNIK